MKKLIVGILAHVDAGKTTLTEAMLYRGGCLRRLGRVDHGDAFLDTDALERERGITIFSKQALLPLPDLEVTLLDTPGHADFSAEMERTLGVLDCAVLVVSGTDGVQGHTETLWRLLARYGVPTLIFVNKMDLPGPGKAALLAELRGRLNPACTDFGVDPAALAEEAALCDEEALARFLEVGTLSDEDLAGLTTARRLFPVWFGSALKLDGVDALLEGFSRFVLPPVYPGDFAARVYKIARDGQGTRLTYLKVTGGCLRVKDLLSGGGWEEKVDQLRLYSGAKYRTVDEAPAGTVCAVTGLSASYAGEGLGAEPEQPGPVLQPVLTYQVVLPEGTDPNTALTKLRTLEEEDPQLRLVWNGQLREIHMQLMGEVQLEVLARVILDRFDLAVTFGAGSIVYRETIAAPVEGVGHYEPLRHYAEVHLLLEPGPRGSGLRFAAACPEETLDRAWQRLILTHLEEKTHLGVLAGAPITDLRITLVSGRAHLKHTEGGDFRQATYRAVRHGLMRAESILLEPWYDFALTVPASCVGRAMTDLQRMGGTCSTVQEAGEGVLTGAAPVAALRDYAAEVTAYTRGRGRLSCALRGYEPCAGQAEAVAALGYDPRRDLENTPDSVFCARGAGFTVPWDEVEQHMHLPAVRKQIQEPEEDEAPAARPRPRDYAGMEAQDKELAAIYERTYGPSKRRDLFQPPPRVEAVTEKRVIAPPDLGPEYLLVDGYNIIFAWDELKAVAADNLDAARQLLMDLLSNYQGVRQCVVVLVFDAYKVPRGREETARYHNIHVVYTKEAETADTYIERTTYDLAKKHRVRVATSDGVEQLIILGHGALRLSARAFHDEMEQAAGQISALLARNNRSSPSRPIRTAMERAWGGPTAEGK